MASDRELMQLIEDTRNGKLPIHEESLVESVVTAALASKVVESATFNYNPDGTLNNAQIGDTELRFIWNADGTLHKVNTYRRTGL